MGPTIRLFTDFLERKISPEEFFTIFSQPVYEEIFSKLPAPSYEKNFSDMYTYILSGNYDNYHFLCNLEHILKDFLEQKNITVSNYNYYCSAYKILLDIQPSWLDIPTDYLSNIAESIDLKNKDVKAILKEHIKNNFICLRKKPKWIQSPQWIIINNKPLIFVDQIDISSLFKNSTTAQLYIFFSEEERSFHTISQHR